MTTFLMTGVKWLLGLLLAIVLALAILMAIIGRENTWAVLFGAPPAETIDFATLEPRATPNSFLVCPEGFCARREPDRISPQYAVAPERLAELVLRVLEATDGLRRDERPRTAPAEGAPSGSPMQWDFIATTPRLKFPDLVTVRIMETAAGQSSLAVYGRAVYGRKDFGANQARIANWLEALEAMVASETGQ